MKKNKTYSIQLPAGQAKPGQKLVFLGKNAMKFCQAFNKLCQELKLENGKVFNAMIKMRESGEYTFNIRGRKTSDLIRELIDGEKNPSEEKLEKIAEEVAKEKINYLTASDLERAKRTILGQIKSMKKNLV